jgi:hypothetical protein
LPLRVHGSTDVGFEQLRRFRAPARTCNQTAERILTLGIGVAPGPRFVAQDPMLSVMV